MSHAHRLDEHPIHLGLGAKASNEPAFTGDMAWYGAYAKRHANDGDEGRLVSFASMRDNWRHWEMHPRGDEVVLCTEGAITLLQEHEEGIVRTHLNAGEYAINPAGVWHTADLEAPASVLFITAGAGTEHRPR
ncbi:MAG: cupin [Myxococcota bacterium]